MLIIPAIDLKSGGVVRLAQGDFKRETKYANEPWVWAKQWEDQGAQWIHVVDLDGAKTGHPVHLEALRKIVKTVNIAIEFGGGLRNLESARQALDAGAKRIVIGTKALEESFLKTLISSFGSQIAVGLDIREGKIQTEGWLSKVETNSLESTCSRFETCGVKTLVFTDTARDGMLEGPNLELLSKVHQMTSVKLILSGGISKLSDLEQLATLKLNHLEGVIIGRALYENKISLREAIQKFQCKKIVPSSTRHT